MSTRRIPCVIMRGGTSRGPYFKASDLPSDIAERDRVLLAVMGSPHPLQVDGIGGTYIQTSKVAIVSPSQRDDADVDYLFAQVSVTEPIVDTKPNCGNMLAGVGPFAIEEGMVPVEGPETRVRVFNVNTGALVEETVQTPDGRVTYEGDQAIDGVNGTAAPIRMAFTNTEGAVTGALFASGNRQEEIEGIAVTLIDNAMPMMMLRAEAVGLAGDEPPEDIDAMRDLYTRLERMRLEAGRRMGLGDVSGLVTPKIGLLSAPRRDGTITSRYLTPHECHRSHAATGAICLATACSMDGTVAADVIGGPVRRSGTIVIEHPSGQIEVAVELAPGADGDTRVARAAILRTARRIFEGQVFVPD
ncbi:MAG: 4-oxalomesaconate tautomerase [Rhodospirillales bacterium]|nr:MAG: 4-oxalomesaconate tautomerase [Rhodospirillales bacterium]